MKAWRDDQLGRLFFVRLRECRWSEALGRELGRASPAGVLLPDELPRSANSTSELLLRMARALPAPPFLALRQEGGAHDPLRRFLPPLPSPRDAAEMGLPAVRRLGELIGEALGLLGFNTNFAPRLDLSPSAADKTHESQTFGGDPRFVAQCGQAFARGLDRHGVLAVGKHFPGLGSVTIRSHGALPVSAKPMAALWREDLVPFRELLPNLPMVLMSAARYKAYDLDQQLPACFSSAIVTGLLREKLGYDGFAVAYDFECAPDIGQAAVNAIDAGCDLLIVDEGEDFERAQQGLKAALDLRQLSRERVERALHRIHAAKRGLRRPSGKISAAAWSPLVQRNDEFSRGFPPQE